MWDLLGNGNLFRTRGPDDKRDNIYQIADMIALLGPPPKKFLERTKGDRVWKWFDENGVSYSPTLVASNSLIHTSGTRKLAGTCGDSKKKFGEHGKTY